MGSIFNFELTNQQSSRATKHEEKKRKEKKRKEKKRKKA
jgi:hypothetical protein